MLISIIIPVYNVAPYVEACLTSVFNQSYTDIEIVIVDDCGTDNSMECVDTIIGKYSGGMDVKLVHHATNQGLSAARNTGVKASTGEYVYFLDSDDSLPQTAIQNLVNKVVQHPNIDFVIGGIQTFGIRTDEYPLLSKEYIDNSTDIISDYLLFKWNVMACNKLIRRQFLTDNQITFKEGIYHEDNDFTFNLALHAKDMACCYTITYLYLLREHSITTQKKIKNFIDSLAINKKYCQRLFEEYTNRISPTLLKSYLTNITFQYILSLSVNTTISTKDKLRLLGDMKEFYASYMGLSHCNRVVFIKYLYIHLPFIIQKKLAQLYYYLHTKR